MTSEITVAILVATSIACISAGVTCFIIALHMRLESWLHDK